MVFIGQVMVRHAHITYMYNCTVLFCMKTDIFVVVLCYFLNQFVISFGKCL